MRNTGPKARRARRLGMNPYGSEKYTRILQNKPQAPGKGPKDNRGKLSEYGQQLLEKQKICAAYGVHNKQLTALYTEASSKEGQTDRTLGMLLELRLDSAIYRAGFALTRLQARQMVSHGHFTVNGKRSKTASIRLRVGDVVAVTARSITSPLIASILGGHQRYTPPSWMRAERSNQVLTFEVLSLPYEEEYFEQAIDLRKVLGYYSR